MRMSSRLTWVLPALALMCCVGLVTAADAGPSAARVRVIRLRRPDGAPARSGAGNVRVRESRRGALVVVRVRGLAATSDYDLRDARRGRALGRITTDRHGRGRLRLDGRDSNAGPAADPFSAVEVVESATGDCVLEAKWRVVWDTVSIGAEAYGEVGGPGAVAVLSAFASDGEEGLSFQFDRPIDPARPAAGAIGYGVSVENDALPFGAARAADLQAHPFEVIDVGGNVLVHGGLPLMDAPRRMRVYVGDPGDARGDPAGAGGNADGGGIADGEPQYFLRLHDGRAREPAILPLTFLWRVTF